MSKESLAELTTPQLEGWLLLLMAKNSRLLSADRDSLDAMEVVAEEIKRRKKWPAPVRKIRDYFRG